MMEIQKLPIRNEVPLVPRSELNYRHHVDPYYYIDLPDHAEVINFGAQYQYVVTLFEQSPVET